MYSLFQKKFKCWCADDDSPQRIQSGDRDCVTIDSGCSLIDYASVVVWKIATCTKRSYPDTKEAESHKKNWTDVIPLRLLARAALLLGKEKGETCDTVVWTRWASLRVMGSDSLACLPRTSPLM